jgi:hypothetical protein
VPPLLPLGAEVERGWNTRREEDEAGQGWNMRRKEDEEGQGWKTRREEDDGVASLWLTALGGKRGVHGWWGTGFSDLTVLALGH